MERFREMQVQHGFSSNEFLHAKEDVQRRLSEPGKELDAYLSGDYGVRPNDGNCNFPEGSVHSMDRTYHPQP